MNSGYPSVVDAGTVIADLGDEYEALDRILVAAGDGQWDVQTPSDGWTVRDEISHLAFSEELAGIAATDPDQFASRLQDLLGDLAQAEDLPRQRARDLSAGQMLDWWRGARALTLQALRSHGTRDRIPWVVGDMSVAAFATARLMETWAHGQDIVDALKIDRAPTARLRHVAELGVRTRTFSFAIAGRAAPVSDARVALIGPAGDSWVWGPEHTEDRVSGTALDFCLVVTQRRHISDTALVVEGEGAREWMARAQAYAGPPGPGRGAGQFS